MPRLGLTDKELLLDARAATWAGLRVVVVDVETTGLNVTTSRIVSVALAEILAGRVLASYATLIDPGMDRIDAVGIHHLTVETIRAAAAPPFPAVAPTLLDRLTPRDAETVILAGHNVVFDALMLHHELARIGTQLPPILLLDTKTLAAHAGVAADNLATLAGNLGLHPTDTHSAVSDAHTTADALLLLADRLREADPTLRIEDLTVEFEPTIRLDRAGSIRRSRKQPPPLTAQHQQAHGKDLTRKRTREAALSVCLAEDCEELVTRVEDAVTTPRSAATVAEWVWGQLDRDDITRATRGRLLSALAVTLARTNDGPLIRAYFDALTNALPTYGTCDEDDQCDRCADPNSKRSCRFQTVRYALIHAFLTRDGQPDPDRAEEFLPYRDPTMKHSSGRPRTGWFGQLVRAGDLDAAGYGAQAAASIGTSSRRTGRELTLLRQAWAAGSRNAKLADQLSKVLLVTPAPDLSRAHLDEALAVCDEALTHQNGQDGRVWDSLRERRNRILIKSYAKTRQPAQAVRNKRPARASRYLPSTIQPVTQPTTQASTPKSPNTSRKRTGADPSQDTVSRTRRRSK